MWTDEDIDVFMKEEFPWFYQRFRAYPKNIQRIDMARYFILYRYGGIYADMDMRCNKYFMDVVDTTRVSIVESGYKEWETVQNSLMISPPGDPFWMKVIAEAALRARNGNSDVMYSTGPILLSHVYAKQEKNVNLLPYLTFNPPRNSDVEIDDSTLFTRHLNTVTWM
jgi:mannosyltransferase OCH1-like enzyme